jgi:serine phosphatase RsbU (regulator of sigma subunit)
VAIDFGEALRVGRDANPATTPDVLAKAASAIRATDLVVYLVDFGQTVLEPIPDRSAHAELAVTEAVATTMAGRAFTDQQVITADRDDGTRVWVPIVEGSDHTGVVAFTIPKANDHVLRECRDIGILAGYLIAAHARRTDLFNLYRRRRKMSLPASMQWDLLPPLVLHADGIALAGLIEPAYDVGGDCFDYAVNGPVVDFAIMDAMGHGLGSALISALAMGCYRHDRREGRSLVAIHDTINSTIESHYDDYSFATGVLGRIEIDTGVFTWTNAGHPRPLLIRNGQVIAELKSTPTAPWGIGNSSPTMASQALEPGDCLMLYTDGVTEARTPDGAFFGLDRLIDLTSRHASDLLRPEVILRQLIASVREHRGDDDLDDDATLVIVQWHGPTNT